jgi:FkbM family methyltransferase
MTMAWYDDAELVASLPRRLRLVAWYSRRGVNRRTGIVRGGSFVYRRISAIGRMLGRPRLAPARVGPHTLWLDLQDGRLFAALAELRHPNAHEARVLDALLPPGATFVDVGANHGAWSLLAGPRVGPAGQIIAVEPHPVLAECVRRSLAASAVPHHVHACALGSSPGRAVLHVPGSGSGSGSLLAHYAPDVQDLIDVDVTTLDMLLADRHTTSPCLLKLDVEGFERNVLRGGREALRRLHPTIIWEVNPTSMSAAGHHLEHLLDAFTEAGYHRFAEMEGWPDAFDRSAVTPAPQRNLIAMAGPA